VIGVEFMKNDSDLSRSTIDEKRIRRARVVGALLRGNALESAYDSGRLEAKDKSWQPHAGQIQSRAGGAPPSERN